MRCHDVVGRSQASVGQSRVAFTGMSKPGTTSVQRYASVSPVIRYSRIGIIVVRRYWSNTRDRSRPARRLMYSSTWCPVTVRCQKVRLSPRRMSRQRTSSSTSWRIVCSMFPPLGYMSPEPWSFTP